ncbi:hypothetical protein PanWU01x14_309100 [Parasponia andersonii]|uniref:Uncharacterized protein n=1 Tax=Parasponia andersonii TaxID=3476 RepID=A0A2P5AQS5_PARAD|nr:hypothetical protein PanWU01x14_309100 [Parasponia andersonii]
MLPFSKGDVGLAPVFRDKNGEAKGLAGQACNVRIYMALVQALDFRWSRLVMESDAASVIKSLKKGCAPCDD